MQSSTATAPVLLSAGPGVVYPPDPPTGLFLETLARTSRLTHGTVLPRALTSGLISPGDQRVLDMVLSFLEEEGLPAQLLISGGYVRDLLLGVPPDDLDLSICLRECAPGVTIATIVEGLPAFVARRPELDVAEVAISTALSDSAKGKAMDTAKVTVVTGSERLHVDFMPTIGLETYDDDDRVPVRDVRGTPEQDALRRDLTIGSMLIEVRRKPREQQRQSMMPPWIYWPRVARDQLERVGLGSLLGEAMGDGAGGDGAGTEAGAGKPPLPELQFTLLDHYGGIADLRARVLRSPVPSEMPMDEVWREVMATRAESQLAAQLGIGLRIASPSFVGRSVWACGARLAAASEAQYQRGVRIASAAARSGAEARRAGEGSAAAAACEPDQKERNRAALLQAVWWVKVLRDDPLRVLRAGRFTSRLGFPLHEAFWFAVPFALASLQTKVAGSRKFMELRKVSTLGLDATLDFLEFAFGRVIGAPSLDSTTVDDDDGDDGASADGGEAAQGGAGRRLAFVTPVEAQWVAAEAAEVVAAEAEPDDAPDPFGWWVEDCRPRTCLAPAIFGGADARTGEGRFLSQPLSFDEETMREVAAALPEGLSADEVLGAALAAAVCSCSFARADQLGEKAALAAQAKRCLASDVNAGTAARVTATESATATAMAAAMAAAETEEMLREVGAACDGLCAPSAMRTAAEASLTKVVQLLSPPPETPELAVLAAYAREAAAGTGDGDGDGEGDGEEGDAMSAAEFGELCHLWDVLRLAPSAQAKAKVGAGAEYLPFVLALARTRCADAAVVDALGARVELLQRDGGAALAGGSVAGLASVPPRQRGTLLTQLSVLCRVRGDADVAALAQPEQLEAYLQQRCPGLLTQLRAGWATEWGQKKPEGS